MKVILFMPDATTDKAPKEKEENNAAKGGKDRPKESMRCSGKIVNLVKNNRILTEIAWEGVFVTETPVKTPDHQGVTFFSKIAGSDRTLKRQKIFPLLVW